MNKISWQASDFITKILLSYLRSPDNPMKVRLIQTIIDCKPLSLEQNPLEDNAWFRDITYCH